MSIASTSASPLPPSPETRELASQFEARLRLEPSWEEMLQIYEPSTRSFLAKYVSKHEASVRLLKDKGSFLQLLSDMLAKGGDADSLLSLSVDQVRQK